SAPERWEFDSPGVRRVVAADGSGPGPRRFTALVVVYADAAGAVQEMLDDLRGDLGEERGVVEVGVEHGAENTTFKEHFGFSADGLSQPIVQGIRSEDSEPNAWVVRTGEFVLGYLNELGHYPPSPGVAAEHDPRAVLPTFPDDGLPGFGDFGRNGTYLVYRKLHQDVAGFWRHVHDSVPRAPTGSRESAMAALAAKYLGRWPSGAPLVLAPDADDSTLGDRNDFMYRPIDPDGLACPVGAHIRRANPRDGFRRIADTAEESIRNSNQHRILRRGISYGDPLFAKEEVERGHAPIDLVDDGRPRGLHFLAVNSDIQRQFEFVQETWLNNGNFNGLVDNRDPLVGDNDGSGTMTIQRRPVRRRVRDVPRFVHVRGGAYLFLPSITALRFLGGEG
ncbi:MAG: Dyp-type peroxidase, partial [Acidimicrobiales bacterium]